MFNVDHPTGYNGRSFSISDVVEFVDDGVFYFCDFIGFKKMTFGRERTAMTVWNNGTLTVDRPMPAEICKKVREFFDSHPGGYVESQSITFEDTPDYRLNESSEMQDLLAENGIGLELGSRVEYYGNYEG